MRDNWLWKAINRFLAREGREERVLSVTELSTIIASHFNPDFADGPQPHPVYGIIKPVWGCGRKGWIAMVERPDLLFEGVVVKYSITDPKSEIEASNFLDFNTALPITANQIIECVRSNMDKWGCNALDYPRSLEIVIGPLEEDLHTEGIRWANGIAANGEWHLFFDGLRFLGAYPGTDDPGLILDELEAERDKRAN